MSLTKKPRPLSETSALATQSGPTAGRAPLAQRLKLPPECEALMRGIVATSVGVIRSLRPDWYFAKLNRPTHLRIYFGHLIVLSVEGAYVWAAIDEAALGDRDRLLKSWVWDEPELRPVPGNAYPRYRSPDSRNGFYDPSRDADGAEWFFIEAAHHAYLRVAATHGRAPDHRTRSDPGLVEEIDSWQQPYGTSGVALEHAVREALRDTSARRTRLASAPKKPILRLAPTWVFVRNADVVAEVLHRSKGRCEVCHKPAPFVRASDGSPYLEVHHRVRLADQGDDTVENAIALCPNCHRKEHYG